VSGLRAIAVLGLTAVALGAGCGGSSAGSPAGPAGSAPGTIDPNFDVGQTVLITQQVVRPLWLVPLVGKPIVFRNLTNATVRVVFDHQPVRSGPIAPGGVFRYTPTTPISMTYHVGHRPGKIQVSPPVGGS
jgi:hypothetical protein